MINHALPEFWQLYNQLPLEVREQANECFHLFRENPQHPSLRFKPLHGPGNIYSVRVGLHYRAVSVREGDTINWFWIGSHGDFDHAF